MGSYDPRPYANTAKYEEDRQGAQGSDNLTPNRDQSVQDFSLGGGVSTIMGGQNTYNVSAPKMDPYAFMYGGNDWQAKQDANRQVQMGNDAQNRQGADLYDSRAGTDYSASRMMGAWSRGDESEGLNAYRQAMNGAGDSVAQHQLTAGMQQAQANAASTAASARGGGANLAAAQRLGAQQQMQAEGDTRMQSGMLRANEIAQARQGFGGMASQMRGQDLQNSNMALSAANAQMGSTMQQRQMNDTRQAGAERQAYDITRAQQEGNSAFQSKQAQMGLEAQEENRKTNQANSDAAAKSGNGIMGMFGMSDENAKTGIRSADDDAMDKQLHDSAFGDYKSTRQPDAAPAQNSGGGGMLGGLMGGGGGGMMGMMSDKEAKEDARKLGHQEMAQALGAGFAPGGSMSSVYGGTAAQGQAPRWTGRRPIDTESPYAEARAPMQSWGGSETPNELSAYDTQRNADIHSGQYGHDADATQKMLDNLKAYEYKYKEPEKYGQGKRTGIMAQDLEKSPMGAQAVMNTPNGKMIDLNKATSLSLAANANNNDRINELEEELAIYRRRA